MACHVPLTSQRSAGVSRTEPSALCQTSPRTTLARMPLSRGINSIQLVKLGPRWWVASIMWDAERAGVTIPAAYLGR